MVDNGLGQISGRVMSLEDKLSAIEAQLGALRVTEDVTEDWEIIPFRFVSVSSGSTGVITRTIAGDGPFDLIEITAVGRIDATGVSTDRALISIKEGEAIGRGLTFENIQIEMSNISGTAQRPYIIKGRRRYRANIAIVVELLNQSGATASFEVALHGVKVYTR